MKYRKRLLCAVSLTALFSGPALALPVGESITSGAASSTIDGSSMTIKQTSGRASANYTDFSVGAGETVKIEQPGTDSIFVAKVNGGIRSMLDGRIEATGGLWLVNPAGITQGPGGVLDIGGSLVLSTAPLSSVPVPADGTSLYSVADEPGGTINLGGMVSAKELTIHSGFAILGVGSAATITDDASIQGWASGIDGRLTAGGKVTVKTTAGNAGVSSTGSIDAGSLEMAESANSGNGGVHIHGRVTIGNGPSTLSSQYGTVAIGSAGSVKSAGTLDMRGAAVYNLGSIELGAGYSSMTAIGHVTSSGTISSVGYMSVEAASVNVTGDVTLGSGISSIRSRMSPLVLRNITSRGDLQAESASSVIVEGDVSATSLILSGNAMTGGVAVSGSVTGVDSVAISASDVEVSGTASVTSSASPTNGVFLTALGPAGATSVSGAVSSAEGLTISGASVVIAGSATAKNAMVLSTDNADGKVRVAGDLAIENVTLRAPTVEFASAATYTGNSFTSFAGKAGLFEGSLSANTVHVSAESGSAVTFNGPATANGLMFTVADGATLSIDTPIDGALFFTVDGSATSSAAFKQDIGRGSKVQTITLNGGNYAVDKTVTVGTLEVENGARVNADDANRGLWLTADAMSLEDAGAVNAYGTVGGVAGKRAAAQATVSAGSNPGFINAAWVNGCLAGTVCNGGITAGPLAGEAVKVGDSIGIASGTLLAGAVDEEGDALSVKTVSTASPGIEVSSDPFTGDLVVIGKAKGTAMVEVVVGDEHGATVTRTITIEVTEVPVTQTCEELGTCPKPEQTCEELGTCPKPEQTCEELGTCPKPDEEIIDKVVKPTDEEIRKLVKLGGGVVVCGGTDRTAKIERCEITLPGSTK